MAANNPWLSVTPVSEYNRDPSWAADYPDVTPPRGLHLHQTGRLPDVVTRVRRLGRPADTGLRRTGDGPRHQGGADRQRGSAGAYSARPAVTVSLSSVLVRCTLSLCGTRRQIGSQFVPDAGMIGISLTDSGVELLGQRRGLDAYVARRQDDGHPDLVSVGESIGRQHIYRRGHDGHADAGRKRCSGRSQRAADPRRAGRLSGLAGDTRIGQRADRRGGLRRRAAFAGQLPVSARAGGDRPTGRADVDDTQHGHRDR